MNYIKPNLVEYVSRIRNRISDSCNDLSDDEIYDMLQENVYYDCESSFYDLWGASADCLELLAAKYKTQFSFSNGNARYELKQKYDNCISLAEVYRSKAYKQSIQLTRNDTWY